IRVAMRDGGWKLVAELPSPRPKASGEIAEGETEAMKQAELEDFHLYNLRNDIAEQRDLQATHPAKFRELRDAMIAFHHDVRNEQPLWPAWEWPRYESQHIVWPAYWKPRKK
ncbi:MAG: hypothetical protein KDA69_22250, partial [Planctomycetaceae bacterium]|nr:hypothetical protein [Planctomycetaceae bacterium]